MSNHTAAQLVNEAYQDVENGDFLAARKKLEKSIAIDDSIPDAHNEYALVMTKLAKPKVARHHILRAIELAPRNPKFWMSLANVCFLAGDLSAAIRGVLVAEQVDPTYKSIPLAKMQILHACGASADDLAVWTEQVREFYKDGRRADGNPLRMGDTERFLTLGRPKQRSLWQRLFGF